MTSCWANVSWSHDVFVFEYFGSWPLVAFTHEQKMNADLTVTALCHNETLILCWTTPVKSKIHRRLLIRGSGTKTAAMNDTFMRKSTYVRDCSKHLSIKHMWLNTFCITNIRRRRILTVKYYLMDYTKRTNKNHSINTMVLVKTPVHWYSNHSRPPNCHSTFRYKNNNYWYYYYYYYLQLLLTIISTVNNKYKYISNLYYIYIRVLT